MRSLLRSLVPPFIVGVAACACTTGDASSPSIELGGRAIDEPKPLVRTPTWFRDVEPIVQAECAGCHVDKGTGGFPLDKLTTQLLASLVADQVSTRSMPPWPPGAGSAPIVGARSLSPEAIATMTAWVAAGAPEGDPRDHVERTPAHPILPPRPADLRLELTAADAYREPTSPMIADEIRCFVLELPPGVRGAWVTAARWRAATPAGIHELGGVAVDERSANVARARSGADGRAGFECGGGLGGGSAAGEITTGVPIAASSTGSDAESATVLPAGTAVRIPAGGAVVMRVHYAVKHLGHVADRSGVDLWLANDDERRALRPLVASEITAPVEVPCPSGVSSDPSDPCSRENAFARLATSDPAAARARADALLDACGTTAAALGGAATVGPNGSFFVPTSCAAPAPFPGVIRIVHAHMQTRGARIVVEAERPDRSWAAVLDVPRWRWAWESAYVLEQGVPVHDGGSLRVSCTFDNGAANQWSKLTGEPGHDALARPPLLPPSYLVAAPNRAAEACSALVAIERAPYRDVTWPTLCHEAQAIAADACGGSAPRDLVGHGCTAADRELAADILAKPAPLVRAAYCP